MPYSLLTHALVFTAGFGAGTIVGLHAGEGRLAVSDTTFRRVIAVAVTVTWITAVVADITVTTYDVPVLIHGIMGAVAGYLFSDGGLNIDIGRR